MSETRKQIDSQIGKLVEKAKQFEKLTNEFYLELNILLDCWIQLNVEEPGDDEGWREIHQHIEDTCERLKKETIEQTVTKLEEETQFEVQDD